MVFYLDESITGPVSTARHDNLAKFPTVRDYRMLLTSFQILSSGLFWTSKRARGETNVPLALVSCRSQQFARDVSFAIRSGTVEQAGTLPVPGTTLENAPYDCCIYSHRFPGTMTIEGKSNHRTDSR